MTDLTLWELLLPLLGTIILGLAGRVMSRRTVLTVALGACGLAFLFAALSFLSMLNTPVAARLNDQVVYTWLISGDLQLSFGLLFDPLSAIMLLLVTGIGFIIHIYSAGYMKDDPGFWRFCCFLNFFIFAMVLLVSADNFLFLLVGWSLVGLASLLLIGFWYQRRAAVAAAQKAFVINVIGDFALLIAIFFIFTYTATRDGVGILNYFPNPGAGHFTGVFTSLSTVPQNYWKVVVICLLLFVACAAKSAQLPLYMWLPDAIAAPAPVSALMQGATMVTAGVYLIARANALFEVAPRALLVVAIIGAVTALFAATIAVFQLDIKRILAYSTISQLGYMFMSEGVHNYSAGIFHLSTHAYFKALLFLAAGAVIHALGGEQDMRQMGGLRKKLPITFWTFLIAALAISGIPPFSGFWSKDEILSSLLARGGSLGYALWAISIVTAALTAFYMFRLIFGIFTGSYRGTGPINHPHADEDLEENVSRRGEPLGLPAVGILPPWRDKPGPYDIHEAPTIMTIPMIILAVLSLVGGLVGSFSILHISSWHPFITFLSSVFSKVHEPQLALTLLPISSLVSVFAGLLGIAGAYVLYSKGFEYKESKYALYQLVFHKYYIDEFFALILIQPLLWLGRTASRWIEGNTLDSDGQGKVWLLQSTNAAPRRLQTGYMRHYVLAILCGAVLIIVYYTVRK